MNFASLTWPEPAAVAGNAVAVLPIAATELHGPHLPISTDSCIAPVRLALAQFALSFPPSNVAVATYWEMAGKAFAGESPMESSALSHACEYENSLMLHLHLSLVRLEPAAAKGVDLFAKALDALEAFVHYSHSWPMPEDLRHA